MTGAPKKILIADDEPNIVTALEFLLRRHGFEVDIARNGEDALAKMQGAAPDLVLLDVMMPLVSGYDVCRRIRELPSCAHVKVVMLSARGREQEVAQGTAAGADLYVVKPFSTRELLQQIHALLGRP
jgi:DNA-binding response OmpR family regulator